MLLEQLLNQRIDHPRATLHFPAAWGQGRATFGGVVCAAALSQARSCLPAEDRPLRTFNVSFIAPVEAGDAELTSACLRSGATLSYTRSEIRQEGECCALIDAAFGVERDSALSVADAPRPAAADVDQVAELPYIAGVTPVFTQQFAYRFTDGAFPFTGADSASFAGWCRFRNASGPATAEAMAMLVDAWPPPLLSMLAAAAPSSSVQWSMQLLATPNAALDDWWFFAAETRQAGGGYGCCTATLWDPDGVAVARSVQLVAVFDR
ncbi:MAG: thioesterase family protein [Deltaproteobacteria bacterium]|nr:thioesterase family protein [Deltaproteobacteria bacterium]